MKINFTGLSGLFGFIIGLLLCVIIFKIINKNKKSKSEYDERQELIRGRGFKYGFYTAIFYMVVAIFPPLTGIDISRNGTIIFIIGICLSVSVVCIYNIWNDSYWGLNNDKRKYIILIICIALFNGYVAADAIIKGNMIQNGVIKGAGANLVCAITFIIILLAILLKSLLSKQEDENNG